MPAKHSQNLPPDEKNQEAAGYSAAVTTPLAENRGALPHDRPLSQTRVFSPQYYCPHSLEGSHSRRYYQDHDFWENPLREEHSENIPVKPALQGAGMTAASFFPKGHASLPPSDQPEPSHSQAQAPVKHTPAKRAPAKKATPKRAPAKKAPAKRAPAKRVPQSNKPHPAPAEKCRECTKKSHKGVKASPIIAYTDSEGTVWIKFEYTRKGVKGLHRVRCDVERVNEACFTAKFKKDNCIYPGAMAPVEEYNGKRQEYETECNHLGWRLVWLNPDLYRRRGLIQRAVDSYRNSSGDANAHSRRVRRLDKLQTTFPH